MQEYVPQLHWEALNIPPRLHGHLGHDIHFDWDHERVSPEYGRIRARILTTRHSFVGALLTRFFLGFVEAAFFPGALFLLSKWYKRSELGVRTAVLSCGSLISNAFGSLIASGILDGMEGKLGHAAWR